MRFEKGTMQVEKAYIEKIVSGDMQAFREFIEEYQRLVCHVVFRMVLNESDREEICQEVFVKIYQNLGKFEFKSKLSTWIARIAYNTCINYLKKKKVPLYDDLAEAEWQLPGEGAAESADSYIDSVAGEMPLADELMMSRELNQFLHAEINRLPLQYRTILTLYHLDELSYKEIEEIVNLPEGTVKSYLFRARKLLKERLLENYPAEELW
jgi:RNA polymerase sigma-70 factor (ECF subfamily)